MKKYNFPPGEKGSINDLSKRFLTESDEVVLEVHDRPNVCLNIISCLNEHTNSDIALSFAKKIIELI